MYFENELLVGSQGKNIYRYSRDGMNLGTLKTDMSSVTCLSKYHQLCTIAGSSNSIVVSNDGFKTLYFNCILA